MRRSVFIGYDPRETEAFAVCRQSIRRLSGNIPISAVALDEMREAGLYHRPTSRKDGRLWDDISEAPMSTAFAISRFLTPILAKSGWALFMDCDVLARNDLYDLFDLADPSYAVMCVKHHHVPPEGVKMDGQLQTLYARKNWSSVMLFNCDHPANRRLTVELINTVPGRDLHRFCWLEDDEIGALPQAWNWLAGYSPKSCDPSLVHFTNGTPNIPGYEDAPYADEWLAERRAWLNGRLGTIPREPKRNGLGVHA
jgi:hypothetical protein